MAENADDPAPLEEKDVPMPSAGSGEFTSVKRGAVAVADAEERARLRLRSEGKRGQNHDIEDTLEPKAKTEARQEFRRVKHATSP